ncbi:MAG: HAMP domain-containing sensor histidine kinase [Deltaproteobacteria bacterium]
MSWRGRRLQQQLFLWLGVTSLATVLAAGFALHALAPAASAWPRRVQQLSAFAAAQFAEHWADAPERHAFAERVADAFEAQLQLSDAQGHEIERVGVAVCRGPQQSLRVTRQGRELGSVRVCFPGASNFGRALLAVLGSACLVLWASAALVARRLVRPLSLLIATTREIGSGNLSARVRLGRHQRGEIGLLAESVNDMAQRIERQMRDQRELLAAVSHEVRSPLARLRVASEILRNGVPNPTVLDAVEREVSELDVLVGKLLASSRLDFESLSKQPVVARELVLDVLQRRKLDPRLLEDQTGGKRVAVDPTLISLAVDNLLDNAERHGGGVVQCCLRIEAAGTPNTREARAVEHLIFEVRDAGPGFEPRALSRVFEAFYRGGDSGRAGPGSLGLGLALVQRIARAHGGRAWAENVGGGASVALSVAL